MQPQLRTLVVSWEVWEMLLLKPGQVPSLSVFTHAAQAEVGAAAVEAESSNVDAPGDLGCYSN